MKTTFSFWLLCALSLCLVSCASGPQRRVTMASALRKGAVTAAAPAPGQVPMQSVTVWNSDSPAHGCDVTVAYHGEDMTEAHLEYVSPADPALSGGSEPVAVMATTNRVTLPLAGPLNPYSSRRVGSAGTTVTLQNVTQIKLVCGDSAHAKPGECAFSIKDIDCSRGASQVYYARSRDNALARVQVAGPSGRRVVWAAPQVKGKAQGCNVTTLLRGSKFCNARVWTSDAAGNVTGFEFAREEAGFVTFHNIAKLELECGSSADKAVGDCLVEVVQTECDK